MRTRMVSICVTIMAVAAGAADAPYNGTWKYDPQKSDLGTVNLTIERTSPDELQQTWSWDHRPSRFKIDDKEYPLADGVIETWKQVDPNAWEVRTVTDGKVTATDVFKLSEGGKTLTDTRSAGGALQAVVMHRSGTGSGLVGTWKGEKVELMPFTLEISHDRDGSITVRKRTSNVVEFRGQFDGKTYPVSGTEVPPGTTATLLNSSARGFSVRQIQPKGPMLSSTITVSDDGNTLTEHCTLDVPGGQQMVYVYDRQK